MENEIKQVLVELKKQNSKSKNGNRWYFVIAAVFIVLTFCSTFVATSIGTHYVYGYRVEQIEKESEQMKAEIMSKLETINGGVQDIKIEQAKLSQNIANVEKRIDRMEP